ncbi:hypothetical protein BDZ90DRAFT_228363 [Jaminaea rosea]|uniref:Inhibitor of growth protein N-terminal histone-binding domain-containing protein n=1 Tax=Jaminaea rosea TaxID=1569628 RepID=A0A316UKB9_9BASI|nr:hypothetical protein BDZ90DRAFT_228363 [Jaminaea rosea]PWN25679.1 hypothetical protein BDZ90DRAFT_228363 [Jaminaea rosea]
MRDKEAEKEQRLFDGWREEYFEIIEQLPLELHRSFALIRELEGQIRGHMGTIRLETASYVRGRRERVRESANGEEEEEEEGEEDFATPPLPVPGASAPAPLASLQPAPPARPPPPYTRPSSLTRISRSLTSIIASSEEKVGLALSAYQLIDRQCRRLDVELAKMTGQQAGSTAAVGTGTANTTATATAPSGEAVRPGTMESGVSQMHIGGVAKANGGTEEQANSSSGTTLRSTRSRRGGGPSQQSGAPLPEPSSTASASTSAAASASAPPLASTSTHLDVEIEMAYDPNEPVYCYCQLPSSGNMDARRDVRASGTTWPAWKRVVK